MPSLISKIGFDEHLARLLFLTLLLTLILTEFAVLGELLVAAVLATALLVLYTSIQAFRYGYLEGRLNVLR